MNSGQPPVYRSERFYYDGQRRIAEVVVDPVASIAAAIASEDEELLGIASIPGAIVGDTPDGKKKAVPLWFEGLQQSQLTEPPPAYISREYIWGPGDRGPDELLAMFAWDGVGGTGNVNNGTARPPNTLWSVITDASGDCVGLITEATLSQDAQVAWQATYEPYGTLIDSRSIVPHPHLKAGHKGLFAERLDGGPARFDRFAPSAHQDTGARHPDKRVLKCGTLSRERLVCGVARSLSASGSPRAHRGFSSGPRQDCRGTMSSQPTTSTPTPTGNVESSLVETRLFPPPSAASLGFEKWHVPSRAAYDALHARSIKDPEHFWAEEARGLSWFKPFEQVCTFRAGAPAGSPEANIADTKWFLGGQLNASYNCLDRHVLDGHGEQTAVIWEGEPVDSAGNPELKHISYREMLLEVCRCANALKSLGVKKGDIVTIYMPMIPELVVAMLACARIGAAHSVIFGGFAHTAISERVSDANSKVIITADGSYRRGDIVPLLKNVDDAVRALANHGHIVDHVLCVRRTGKLPADQDFAHGTAKLADTKLVDTKMPTKYHWWHQIVPQSSDACPAEACDSEDLLFLLYTSGSTGKPKGIMHTTGGYLTYVKMTARLTFNLSPQNPSANLDLTGRGRGGVSSATSSSTTDNPIFWCTADIGWITGHSYVVYGLMMNRVPTLLYEGAPNFPTLEGGRGDRFWQIIARHKVTHFYTAPTAIRTFMKWGDDLPARHDLSSLRILGSVGEPINPEAWMWYHKLIGREKCPIVDTYWQTETAGHICTPLPGAIATKPGSCTVPMIGIDAACVNEQGQEMPANTGGLFVIRKPWPGMLRGVFGNRERFLSSYWGRVKDPATGVPYYFSADGTRRDADGAFWIQGRIDDVIKVSGHLLGTMEVESAMVSHPAVAEAAVVGFPHELKGNAICAFVTLKPAWLSRNNRSPDDTLKKELAAHVAKEVGALARPDQVRFAESLPKTRSGKIMRRLLRDVAAGVEKITQDTTTLEDFSVVSKLRQDDE